MIDNTDGVKGNIEKNISIRKEIGLDLYFKSRLKLIQDFEEQCDDDKQTDLKKLLELEKAAIIQATRKF